MSPPDRLAELRRQRALLQQHSDWLDSEIAAAQAGAPPVAPPPSATPSAVVSALPAPMPGPVPALDATDPDAILSQYRSDESRLKTDVRKGCLLYSAIAFLLLILGVFGLYFLLRRPPG
jgi:hypothetical protein